MKIKEKDYREGQKVVATIEIEDQGQDFTELDLLENGVLLGNSIMFKDGRLSLLGIEKESSFRFYTAMVIIQTKIGVLKLKGSIIYLKNTGEEDPFPWKARRLKYPVVKIKKAIMPDRFIKK